MTINIQSVENNSADCQVRASAPGLRPPVDLGAQLNKRGWIMLGVSAGFLVVAGAYGVWAELVLPEGLEIDALARISNVEFFAAIPFGVLMLGAYLPMVLVGILSVKRRRGRQWKN